MKKFKVTLIETLERVVEIEAENYHAAQKITMNKYDAEEDGFVLTADNSESFIEIGDVEEIEND